MVRLLRLIRKLYNLVKSVLWCSSIVVYIFYISGGTALSDDPQQSPLVPGGPGAGCVFVAEPSSFVELNTVFPALVINLGPGRHCITLRPVFLWIFGRLFLVTRSSTPIYCHWRFRE